MAESMAALRRQASEELGWMKLDPKRYNVNGIVRDAWINGNGSEETWKAAVEKNRYPFLIGDTVRVIVEIDGFQEHMYGFIGDFRTAVNGLYRRRTLKPHSAYVDLIEISGVLRPLTEITPEIDDFDVTDEHGVVHHNGPKRNYGIFHCNSGRHGPYAPPADVMVTHKPSGEMRRWCNECNDADKRAVLGHLPWHYRQRSLDTIRRLMAHPKVIAGPADDYEASGIRDWADVFPYLVPAEAAELYVQWKANQGASAA